MTISSIVIRTRPENLAQVKEALVRSELAEVHFSDDNGQLVVTIEGQDIEEQTEKLKSIQALPHVLTANLSYVVTEEANDSSAADQSE